MLAHVHHRVHPGPQPGVEGEVAVRRHERGVVVGRARVDVVAARGLDPHRHVAEAHRRHREAGRPVRRRHEERVPFGGAPALAHRVAHFRREAGEEGEVVVQRKPLADLSSRRFRVRGPRRERPDERVPVRGDAVHGVSRRGHRAQQLHGSGGGVEADAVAEAPVAVGVVREHDADTPCCGRRCGQRDPRAGERGGELDAVGAGRVRHDRALGPRVEAGLGLEGHRTGENAAVHLGQRDVHRDVARRQSLHAPGPALLVPAREHHLEHRPPAGVEGPLPPLRARRCHREAGGVQHQAHVRLVQHPFREVRGDGVLQARHVERERVHPAGAERARERVDGGEVGRLKVRAIEDDGGGGGVRDPLRDELFEAAHARARTVDPGARQGGGLAPLAWATDEIRRKGEQVAGIGGTRVHAVLPQAVGGLGRHTAEGHELGIGLIVAGQEGERDRSGIAGLDELLDAVGPVAAAPEHARDDELRLRDHRLDVGVH